MKISKSLICLFGIMILVFGGSVIAKESAGYEVTYEGTPVGFVEKPAEVLDNMDPITIALSEEIRMQAAVTSEQFGFEKKRKVFRTKDDWRDVAAETGEKCRVDVNVYECRVDDRAVVRTNDIDRAGYGIWYKPETEEGLFSFVGDNGDGVEHIDYSDYDYEDDPAVQIWGGVWRTPSPDEFSELVQNTDNDWTNDYNDTGVKGWLFISKTDSEKKLFLPAAGCYGEKGKQDEGFYGNYWSSSLSYYSYNGGLFYFFSGDIANDCTSRWRGCSVRPVAE